VFIFKMNGRHTLVILISCDVKGHCSFLVIIIALEQFFRVAVQKLLTVIELRRKLIINIVLLC
jgi:hypothetical protein